MPRLIVGLFAAFAAAVPAAAQSIGEPIPGRGAPASKLPAPKLDKAARPCPEYGPGYVRVDGSSFCVRAGGSVRAEFGKRSDNRYGSAVGATAQLEARGESTLGPVRAIVRGKVQSDRGVLGDSFYR
ncbi:hypothetical protein FG93_05423 [Bosea sp. LC85]|uniref:hypothetical protein n=1 Tax=Bosea sp. LC85 TaxID=1502851 RepID=UPI0004E3BBAC|nr:hypothetical protein [Bosea sp. LC85]KFC63913.1 hypothetical protein FG93_05423 [Bosea sp. LC85]